MGRLWPTSVHLPQAFKSCLLRQVYPLTAQKNAPYSAHTICSFKAHRPKRLGLPESDTIKWLKSKIRKAIGEGYITFIIGMWRDVDIRTTEIVIKIRSEGADVKLISASTFNGIEQKGNTVAEGFGW